MATLDNAFADLWHSIKSTIPLNPEAAIYVEWRKHYQEWGAPIGNERDIEGGVYQVFTHAIVTWTQERGAEVVADQ